MLPVVRFAATIIRRRLWTRIGMYANRYGLQWAHVTQPIRVGYQTWIVIVFPGSHKDGIKIVVTTD